MIMRRFARNWVLAPLAIMLASSAIVDSSSGLDTVTGSQGIDTALPATDSAVTVSGRGKFENLNITVNQTQDLSEQAISVTWENGEPTQSSVGRFGGNYLQIMQCWGDDDGSVPENPGPPPEQCVYGAYEGRYGGFPGGVYPDLYAVSRAIYFPDWASFDPAIGTPDPAGSAVWRGFRSVDGTTIGSHLNALYLPSKGGDYWLNPFFNLLTSNEVPGGFTYANGTGSELFQVLTGVQSSGLGCGQRAQKVASERRIPKCWLVIVPRGTAAEENVGSPFEAVTGGEATVSTSPLSPSAWRNRIAVPLEFNPVDSPCALGSDERRVSGNEIARTAFSNWQPALCGSEGLPPFSFASVGDPAARRQLSSPTVGSPGMVVVSGALEVGSRRPDNPVVYAPLTISGLVIGFNVERRPSLTAPQEAFALSGRRIAEMNLTPRLVAKLLTQSYTRAVAIGSSVPPYDWVNANAQSLMDDPDFLRFNPEFTQLTAGSRNSASLSLPTGNSDAATQMWKWILADPEASTWLGGQPDEWGMVVNPVYSTNPATNSTGFAFGNPAPVSFPKSDPYCYQRPPSGSSAVVPPPLCGTDWVPYAGGFDQTAQVTRRADDRARIVSNSFAITPATAWQLDGPQLLGQRSILSVTDTPSALRYGLQVARLSGAGDNGTSRSFVAPDAAGLSAGVRAMRPGSEPQVLDPSPAPDATHPSPLKSLAAPVAYPLTAVTYAAVAPLAIDDSARDDYASFIEFASSRGQQPGAEYGKLAAGYVPLTEELAQQSVTAAATIRELEPSLPQPPQPLPATQPAPAIDTPAAGVPQSTGPLPSIANSTALPQNRTTRPSVPSAIPVLDPGAPAAVSPTPLPIPELAGSSQDALEPEETPPRALAVTPATSLPVNRFAVPMMGGVGLVAALAALELTKRPRKRSPQSQLAEGDTS